MWLKKISPSRVHVSMSREVGEWGWAVSFVPEAFEVPYQ